MPKDKKNSDAKQRILIIDDEEVVRILFISLLSDEGFEPFAAEDGTEGVQLLDEHHPAVALVDKNLPDISGLELIAAQKKRHPDTEFIMITGYASLDSAVKAMEVGAFSYLTKPFTNMDVVIDRIRAALEINSLRVETSQLRNRLDNISFDSKSTHTPTPISLETNRLNREVRETLSFLESFFDKRNHPPPQPIWARMISMMKERCRLLKQALKDSET